MSFGQFGAMTQVQLFSTFIPLLRPSVVVVVIKTLDGAVVGRVLVVIVHCILFCSRRLAMVFECQIRRIKLAVKKIDTNPIDVFEQCSMFAGV